MRIIKGLFVVVFLLALVAGGGYGYYWYTVKTYIDNQIAEIAPFAQVIYSGLVVDPRGEISLEGVNVSPNGYPGSLPMSRLSVKADDPLFFLNPSQRAENGEWPGFSALSVENLRVDILDELSAPGIGDGDAMGYDSVDMGALACGDVSKFTPAVMREMGINSTEVDLTLTATVNDTRGELGIGLDFDMSGIGHSEMELDLTYASGFLRPSTAMAANPRLSNLRLAYQDLGYYRKRDQYCSDKAGVSPEAYREQHLAAVDEFLKSMGMQVPAVLKQVYQDGTSKGGRMEIVMRPPGGLGTEMMMGLGSPNEMVDRLGIRLLVNSNPVDISTVDWMQMMPDPERAMAAMEEQSGGATNEMPEEMISEESEPMASEIEAVAESEPMTEETPQTAVAEASVTETSASPRFAGIPEKEEVIEKRFQQTNYADLSNFIDSDIRIRTYFGNKVEGRLESVEGNRIKILHRLDRGMAIYPVDRDKLESIEVYRE